MSITYTNNYFDKIIKNIEKQILLKIQNIPIFYDENRGQESFLITPVSDSFIETTSNSHLRQYVTEIRYEMRSGSDYTKDNQLKRLTNIAEILKRTFFDQRNIDEIWFDAEVTSVEYEKDEDDSRINRAIVLFQCNNNEVISWNMYM